MTVPMFIFDGGRHQWSLKPMEVIADLRQGRSPHLNCCFLALCVILVEGGRSTTSKSRHTLVEMCIDVFSTSSVHGERRCCTRCTLKFQKLFRTCGLVRKSTVLQGSRDVLEALMRPIYPLKSFHQGVQISDLYILNVSVQFHRMFLIFIFTSFHFLIYNSKLICTKCREIFVVS